MIEVPVADFGDAHPTIVESGEGGPATAPGCTLHGAMYEAGSSVACCWQIHDDTISLCTLDVTSSTPVRGGNKQIRRLKFGGVVLPKPILFRVRDGHRLLLCTAKGDLKMVNLRIAPDGTIDIPQTPFKTIQLPNTQRVSGCIFVPRGDNSSTLWGFVGCSSWEKDTDTLTEVKVLQIPTSGNMLEYKEQQPLRFSSVLWKRGKQATTFTAIQDPRCAESALLITLEVTDAVIYQINSSGNPHEIAKFPIPTNTSESTPTDVNASVIDNKLVIAITYTGLQPCVSLFRYNLQTAVTEHARTIMAPHEGSGTSFSGNKKVRIRIRTSSSAIYIVWQTDNMIKGQSVNVPLLFAALTPEARRSTFAISCIPLSGQVSSAQHWEVVDLTSASRTPHMIGQGGGNHSDVGLCIVDGNLLNKNDICVVMRPGRLSVLRPATPIETEVVVSIPEAENHVQSDTDNMNGLIHPYVSYCRVLKDATNASSDPDLSCKGASDVAFLSAWRQSDTLLSIAAPVIDGCLPRLMNASSDDLPVVLQSIERQLYCVSSRDRVAEACHADIDSINRIVDALLRKVETGTTGLGTKSVATIAAPGASCQIGFALLVLSLHAAALMSISIDLDPSQDPQRFRAAINNVVLHAHTHSAMSVFVGSPVFSAFMAELRPTEASEIFLTIRNAVSHLLALSDSVGGSCDIAPSTLINMMSTAPIQIVPYLRDLLSVGQSGLSVEVQGVVVAHLHAIAKFAHSHQDAPLNFNDVSRMVEFLPPEDQHNFFAYIYKSVAQPEVTGLTVPCWYEIPGLPCDPSIAYLFLAAKSLALNGSAVHIAAAVAVMPPVERLLAGIPTWTAEDWDLLLKVNKWKVESSIERCTKPVHINNPSEAFESDRSTRWDLATRTVMQCPDPKELEQRLSLFIDAVLQAGGRAMQRFLVANWAPVLRSSIKCEVTSSGNLGTETTITIKLPSNRKQITECAIVLSPVPTGYGVGSGVGLNLKSGQNAEQILGSFLKIWTQPGIDTYEVTFTAVLPDASLNEIREFNIIIGYPGLLPSILRCSATPTSPVSLCRDFSHSLQPDVIIARLLWSKGSDKSIHELVTRDNIPNYYIMLVQFLVHRNEFRCAARVNYRVVERIRNAPRADIYELEVACNALVLTKMTLKSGGCDSFSLEGDDPTRQPSDFPNSDSESDIVTIQDLDNRRACLQAELALLKNNTSITPLQLQQCPQTEFLSMLVKRKLFRHAADFAKARNLDLSEVFTDATADCVEVDRSCANRSEKHRLWDELSHLLKEHSTEKVQWKFHLRVIKESLRLGAIPPSKVIDQLLCNRPDMCIRAFIADNADSSLELAASHLTRYLNWSSAGRKTDDFAANCVIPVTLLDSAVETFKSRLSRDASDSVSIKLQELVSLWDQAPPQSIMAQPASITNAPFQPAPTGFSWNP